MNKQVNKNLKMFVGEHDDSFDTLLSKIEKNKRGFLVVLERQKVIGVITDGDVRRYLINGLYNAEMTAADLCNRQYTFAKEEFSTEKKISLFTDKVRFLPILDSLQNLIDIEFSDSTAQESLQTIVNSMAPSRITFGGGGSDKLDYFAHERGICINAAIKKYAFCTIIRSKKIDKVQISSSDYNESWSFETVSDLLNNPDKRLLIYQKVFSYLNITEPVRIFTSCDFPVGSGLGGSSSLTVALLSAFFELYGIKFSKINLAKEAFKLERIAMQINGGWQDQYVASVGGVNALYFTSERHDVHNLKLSEKIMLELQSTLYLCLSGSVHNSSDIHKSITLNELERKTKMAATVRLAEEMLRALTADDLSVFDDNTNENWNMKKQYSNQISNSELDREIEYLMSSGATSAKILGAGGGGYFLVRVPRENFEIFSARCREKSIIPERVLFDYDGAVTW